MTNGCSERYIDLMFDRGFKRVFGKEANKDVFIALLNELIPEKHIVDLEYLNVEMSGLGAESKKPAFDVQCTVDDGSRIIVEVQNYNQEYFRERVLYYASLPVMDQLDAGDDYRLVPVYVISILNFKLAHGVPESEVSGRVRYSYSIREDETNEQLTDRLHFIFLELGRFDKKVEELENDREKWYFCLLHMNSLLERPAEMQASMLKRLFDVAEVEGLPKMEREQYIRDMTTERDIINQRNYARKEGRLEAKAEDARAMLAKGLDVALISEITGLSEEQMASL